MQTAIDYYNKHGLRSLRRDNPLLFARFYKQLLSLEATFIPPAPTKSEVILLVGIPGVGKSRLARTLADPDSLYVVPLQQQKTLWFDGYSPQFHTHLLLEDFSGQLGYRSLLRILDIYDMQVPVKGSFVHFRPTCVVITSNVHPRDWYSKRPEDELKPLYRRFTSVYYWPGSELAVPFPIPIDDTKCCYEFATEEHLAAYFRKGPYGRGDFTVFEFAAHCEQYETFHGVNVPRKRPRRAFGPDSEEESTPPAQLPLPVSQHSEPHETHPPVFDLEADEELSASLPPFDVYQETPSQSFPVTLSFSD